jgi:hypothetical protein
MSLVNRRDFLKSVSVGAGMTRLNGRGVSIVSDPRDPVASSGPAIWAAAELQRSLEAKGVSTQRRDSLVEAPSNDFQIVLSGPAHAQVSEAAESFAFAPESSNRLIAAGRDPRGLVYATLELADRVRFAPLALAALQLRPEQEQSANRVRSIARCFVSDVEDKSWYYDRAMWNEYLTMLAAQRLNRFSMTFGLAYNWPMRVTDSYLYFTYPFLFDVPGYNVRVKGLPDAERDRNFETLQFIGEQTVKRGLQFQVGLWTHAYEVPPGSQPNYVIEGLSKQNHAAYCRDALHQLLERVPSISGLTFRIHGESGIPEADYDFWKIVFQGIVKTGRKIEIDMHAKGMDFKMIGVALATGMPVKVSPKYWAEHMGLGYHQAAIRELEMPPKQSVTGLFALSNGSRKFLRYGYGDLLKEGRQYGILYRIWPGTQRTLLWGDPAMAAAYGRTANLCGSDGVEWCEPLSFKGRMGSGNAGGRCAYADASLNPKYDWQKFEYTYRVWGRLTHNPSANPDGWRRYLVDKHQAAAVPVETAVANASRILPLITTAHGASGSNNTYWPEMYTNMPIVDAGRKQPYNDTPAPKVFANVSAFDPQLFSRISDYAGEILRGEQSGKYSPLDVAQWLEAAAGSARGELKKAERQTNRKTPEFRRMAVDIAIQSGIGSFFASKIRSAVLWEIYEASGDQSVGEEALKAYRHAREAWAELAAVSKPAYVADVSYGPQAHLRGNWSDRLAGIDQDIADMEQRLRSKQSRSTGADPSRVAAGVRTLLAAQPRPVMRAAHTPPKMVRAGDALPIEISLAGSNAAEVQLHYRHVNQAEPWAGAKMDFRGKVYRATIPGEYTKSEYPLQYYFEFREESGGAGLYPGFEANLANQPYFIVRLS